MVFTFDYEETLTRRVKIDADSFMDAINILKNRLDNCEIVLSRDDFIGAEIRMPLKENYLPQLQQFGESMNVEDDIDLLIDFW